VEFGLLGPLEARDNGVLVSLGSAKQRALLALLLLNANRVVSRERLIDDLWGEEPPETAVATVQVYVSRLRKLLPPGMLLTRAPGYLLDVGPAVPHEPISIRPIRDHTSAEAHKLLRADQPIPPDRTTHSSLLKNHLSWRAAENRDVGCASVLSSEDWPSRASLPRSRGEVAALALHPQIVVHAARDA
jgi:hypothetical protein